MRGQETGVTNADNIGLNCRVRSVRGITGGHEAFVEIAFRAIGVVATGGKDNRTLFAHWLVALHRRCSGDGKA